MSVKLPLTPLIRVLEDAIRALSLIDRSTNEILRRATGRPKTGGVGRSFLLTFSSVKTKRARGLNSQQLQDAFSSFISLPDLKP